MLAGAPSVAAQESVDPRAVVGAALRAVEGDSAAALRARWTARTASSADDRAAQLGLATLDRLSYDYTAADRRYASLYDDAAPGDRYAVYARLGAGQGLDTRGHLTQAGEQLGLARAAAARAGDRRAEAEALLALSFIRAQAQGVPVGFAALDTAERLLPAAALDGRAELLRRRAALFAIVGQADSAEALAWACRETARRAGEPRTEATCLRAQAYNLTAQGRNDSASVILRDAERLLSRARDRAGLAVTLMFATDPYLNTGQYGAAKATLERALVEARVAHDDNAIAAVHLGLGSLAIRFADYTSAETELRQAVRGFSERGDTNDAMNAVAFQAYLAAIGGDLARARERYAQVIAWNERIGSARAEFDARVQLAELELRARDYRAAGVALQGAKALARRTDQPRWLSELGYEEGRLALRTGELALAERRLAAYIGSRDRTERLQRHLARTQLAEVYAARGDARGAERELTAAGDELDQWRATLGDSGLRLLAFQASAGDHLSRDASVARVLATLVRAGRVEAAFALAERRRARELVERLTQADALQADGAPAASADRGGTMRRQRGITAAEARAALPDERTALIEYVAGVDGAPTTAFVLTRSTIRARVLAADSATASIDRFVALVENGADPRVPGRRLGRALLDGVLADVPARIDRLLIVADGPLHRVPFDALRLADDRHVVERYTVSLVPSAAVLAALRARPAPIAAKGRALGLLALGDPAFAHETVAGGEWAALVYRDAFDGSGGLPRLAAAGEEVRGVARYAAQPIIRVRDEASEAFLKRQPLEQFGVLHFATHALVDETTLARTALALAPGGGEDGFLSPADLAALRLDAGLVVLSACRTAGGVIVAGEGLQGLTAPLLEAGARSVVATQWRIGDRSTVQLVDDFYRAMAAGATVPEALRAAKLAAIRRGAAPRDWAAFTVVGDPGVRVPLRLPPRSGTWALWATGGLALGAAAWALGRGRRRRVAGAPCPV
jgi:hypothetical protein